MNSAPVSIEATSSSRKAREFARREREILRVALNCFSQKEWETVSVARIASLVGIAKGTMYLHFASKQDIYARLTLDFYTSLLNHLTGCVNKRTDDPLREIIEQAFRFYLTKPKYRCVTQYCERQDFRQNLSAPLASQFDAIDAAFYDLIRNVLTHGINDGRYQSLPLDQTILGLQCTFQGAINLLWCNRHGEQDNPDEFIENISRYMIAPLRKDTSGPYSDYSETNSNNPAGNRRTMESANE